MVETVQHSTVETYEERRKTP